MNLDNKGFAISGVLYSLLILFMLILIGMLAILSTRKNMLDNVVNGIKNDINSIGPQPSTTLLSIIEQQFGKDPGECTPEDDITTRDTECSYSGIDTDSENGESTTSSSKYNYVYFNCGTYPTSDCEIWRIMGVKKDIDRTIGIRLLGPVDIISDIQQFSDTNNVNWESSLLRINLNDNLLYNNFTQNTKYLLTTMKYDITQISDYNISGTSIAWTNTMDNVGLPSLRELQICSGQGYDGGTSAVVDNSNCWMIEDSSDNWHSLITPFWNISSSDKQPGLLYSLNNSNTIMDNTTTFSHMVRPVVNLKHSIKVIGGDGTIDNPWQLYL